MCRKLNICRASYYKWLNRSIPDQEQEDIEISKDIQEYHLKFHGILGYRRMTDWINRDKNKNYKRKRIRRIMHIVGIRSSIRRTRHCCTVSNKKDAKAENILNRNFEASAPNQKWTTDVSEFKIPGSYEKLYLSTFLDLYDRSVIAWVISDHNDNKLVNDTFKEAIKANPEATPLFHSDRGFQYTSPLFRKRLADQGMTQSMSRTACCIDNGPQEAFWGIIKSEMPKLFPYHDRETLIKSIGRYIEFYNHERYQERYNTKTPMEVRKEALEAKEPTFYPIPINPRIVKYNQYLENLRNKKSN